jgi:hypothetical protein
MAWKIQKISDYGTGNPIVARLSIQTKELLPFYNLSDKQMEQIGDLFFANLQPKLVTCSRIKEQLTREVRGHQRGIDEFGLEFQSQGRVYTLPSILDLQHHAETFLYNAKSTLRDLTHLFSILFSQSFKNEARFDKVFSWAKTKFGSEDPLVKMLGDDANTWIKRVVQMRNAVEHPGGYSGILHIENFISIEEGTKILVIEPMWWLNTEEKCPIVYAMDVIVSNLLAFCEETLILCLEKFRIQHITVIAEIPEKDRDPTCPIRFKMTIDS